MKSVKGFSLVELMVVIAIVALLAAVAVPSYREYSGRAALTGLYNIIQKAMNDVAEKYSNGGSLSGVSYSITGVTSVVPALSGSTGGTVTVTMPINSTTFGTNLNFPTAPLVVVYTGTDSNGVMTWACTSATAAATTGQTAGATGTRAASLVYFNSLVPNGTQCS